VELTASRTYSTRSSVPPTGWSTRCRRSWVTAEALDRLIGVAVSSLEPVGGGDICRAYRARLADGRTAFVKTRDDPPSGFFATEAAGLARLRAARGGVPAPEVLGHDHRHLALEWI